MSRWILALVPAIVAVGACRQIVGIGSDPPSGDVAADAGDVDAPAACGVPVPAGACRSCAESSCCDALSSCAADPACRAYETCSLACAGDPACRSRCFEASPIGSSASIPALDACLASSCEAECGLTCGGSSPFALPDAAASCASCTNQNACAESRACARDVDCLAGSYCQASCTTLDCQQACRAAHLSWLDGGLMLTADLYGHCATPCVFGNDWRCVGHVTWPTAKVSSSDITLLVSNYAAPTPARNISVTLCDARSPACPDPIVPSRLTAASGAVTFSMPLAVGGGAPFTFFELTSAGTFPQLFYPGFPMSEAAWAFQINVLKPQEMTDLAGLVGVTLDPTRGHLAMYVFDCEARTSPGSTFSVTGLDAQSVLGYTSNGGTPSAARETDSSGLGFALNVPPGAVTITATPKGHDAPTASMAATVRAGTLTVVNAWPQPP